MPFLVLIWGKHLEIQKKCCIFATRKQQAMRSPLPKQLLFINLLKSNLNMNENLLIQGKTMSAPVKGMLAAEQFLNDNYLLRRNVLNGKVEFAAKPADGAEPSFLPLTQLVLNSIILQAKRENICDGASPKADIMEYVNSAEVVSFDPIRDYLDHLPAWDGRIMWPSCSIACQASPLSNSRF